MAKLEPLKEHKTGRIIGYMFTCPGCGWLHPIHTVSGAVGYGNISVWDFNGDLERPTFSPSLLMRSEQGDPPKLHVCHSFIIDGQIQFLGDCTHELAGQTVELPEIDND